MKKHTLLALSLLIACIGCNSNQAKAEAFYCSFEQAVKTMPGVVNGDYKYSTVSSFNFSSSTVGYVFNTPHDPESTLCFEYGYRDGGLYLVPCTANSREGRIKLQTKSSTNISTADGVFYYVDASKVRSTNGHNIGVGLGFMLMDSPTEPSTSPGFWDEDVTTGHFQYYYPISGRSAFYYDIEKGTYNPTSIIDRSVTVDVGYRGYVYVPFSSYGWKGLSNSEYALKTHAFGRGFNYVNYTHLITHRIDSTSTQTEVFINKLSFIKKTAKCTHNYAEIGEVKQSCHDVSSDLFYCSSCKSYELKNVKEPRGHVYSAYKKLDNTECIGICDDCGHVETFKDTATIDKAELVTDLGVVTYTLHHGQDLSETTKVKVVKGQALSHYDEPRCEYVYQRGFKAGFLVWSSDEGLYTPYNVKTVNASRDRDLYAQYLVYEYDDAKYDHAANIIAKNGGLYKQSKGKVVLNGNSNFALAYQTVSDWAAKGLPTINNSVAGGSTYDYILYNDAITIAYRPKIVCFNLTSNDQAYWSMSEKDIANATIEYIEHIHECLPDCVVAMVNSSPLPGRSEMFATINRLNEWAKSYAESVDYVEYIDTYDFVYERMMEYPDGWSFWTHMDTGTLSVWMNMIGDELVKIAEKHEIWF